MTDPVTELISGAQIHGANGLAVDGDGRLLVASAFGGEIVVVDATTGAIEERLGHESGVDGPDDVAVGPDGSIYWTDIIAGEVGRLEPDTTVSKQAVAPSVNPIAFSDDGRLFVGQAFGSGGDGLYEVDPDLADPPRVVIPDSETAPATEALNGFDFGPDGMLYAPQPFLSRIVRIDPESGEMEVVAEGLAGNPTSVEFDAAGQLFASFGGEVVAVDTETGSVSTRATIPGAQSDNMVFDAAGRLFVSDFKDGAVYQIAEDGGVRNLVEGGLIMPGGVAVMPGSGESESLFVADVWGLVEFDARSAEQIQVDAFNHYRPGIVEPWAVAADDGNVIVSSWASNAVQIWDPSADEVVESYDFVYPANALRFQDYLVVAELGTGSVVGQDADGNRTKLLDELTVPNGLAATETDLWVSDWATGIVWQVVGTDAPREVASGLANPEGMAVDRDGSLLVVESSEGRLSRIDPVTGEVSTVAEGLDMDVQGPAALSTLYVMSGVAVASDGSYLVSGAGAERNVVYRIQATPEE